MKKLTCLSFVFLCSCATVKGWFGWGEDKQNTSAAPATAKVVSEKQLTKFSDQPQIGFVTERQYKRMNKSRLEEESDVGSQAGSMWVMEGQGAYLFAQNKARREGDVLNVKIEGSAMKQVETKVTVIKKLIKQLEDQEREAKLAALLAQQKKEMEEQDVVKDAPRQPASEGAAVTPAPEPAKSPLAAAIAALQAPPPEANKEEKTDLSDLQSVPSRIVEKLPDGGFKIKGTQPFMIGKREYKLIVQGQIKQEDYDESGISSQILLDPQYDVISLRRKEKE